MTRDTARIALVTATNWRKSIRSQGENGCVETTEALPGWIGIRDSKLGPASPVLACTRPEFAALLAHARRV